MKRSITFMLRACYGFLLYNTIYGSWMSEPICSMTQCIIHVLGYLVVHTT